MIGKSEAPLPGAFYIVIITNVCRPFLVEK